VTGLRCEKTRTNHVHHKSGSFVWSGDSEWNSAFGVKLPQSPVTIAFDTTPLKAAGESMLAGIKRNFETMDQAEAATEPRSWDPTPADLLRRWWLDLAEVEVERTVPKAIEYSSTDLVDIGRDLARCMGREIDDEEAAELGVYFYLRGKLARWTGAITNGERISDDTLFDIGVYVRMAQRIRLTGEWPGVDFDELPEHPIKQQAYGEPQ
jgi:hypothetical protein